MTNNNRREANFQGNTDSSSPGPSSPKAAATQDEAEAQEMGNEAGVVTFPQQLMEALERETSREDATVTTDGERVFAWRLAGDGFVIRDRARFAEEVLPKYFNRCKATSFTRKLYRWGFRQVSEGTQLVKEYQHVHFARGEKQRCLNMRSLVKSTTNRRQRHAHSMTGYDAVHQGQPPASFGPASGHRQRVATVPILPTSHPPFPPQATTPRLQSEGIAIRSLPVFVGLEGSPTSSFPEGRSRLEELENSQGKPLDMFNDRSRQAIANHLPSRGNDLPSPHSVLGPGGRTSSTFRMPDNQLVQGMTGVVSAAIAEGRRRLQEMEQNRPQLMDMLNKGQRRLREIERCQRHLMGALNRRSAWQAEQSGRQVLDAPENDGVAGGNGVPSPHVVLGLGGRPSSTFRMPDDQLLQGSTGVVSVAITEGRRRLQEMEQNRQQLMDMLNKGKRRLLEIERRRRQLTNALNRRSAWQVEQSGRRLLDAPENDGAARAMAPTFGHPQTPPPPPPTAVERHHSAGHSRRDGDASHTSVWLALEIMKRGGPGMEPRRALELAGRARVKALEVAKRIHE